MVCEGLREVEWGRKAMIYASMCVGETRLKSEIQCGNGGALIRDLWSHLIVAAYLGSYVYNTCQPVGVENDEGAREKLFTPTEQKKEQICNKVTLFLDTNRFLLLHLLRSLLPFLNFLTNKQRLNQILTRSQFS